MTSTTLTVLLRFFKNASQRKDSIGLDIQVKEFVDTFGCPVMLKAAYGGGGRGMRVVTNPDELEKMFDVATSEALSAFGDGSMFIERLIGMYTQVELFVCLVALLHSMIAYYLY